MKTLAQIRRELSAGDFEFTRHAFLRAVERNISELEIRSVGEQSEVIEEYPDDKYSPSLLLFGFTRAGRPLHLQVSAADSAKTKIITLYEPDPEDWDGFRTRR